jgi:recombination DNA repair RAD52 pathway protein
VESLEGELRSCERRSARKESALEERLRAKSQALASATQLVQKVRHSQQQLARQLSDLRASASKMRRAQLHVLRQARAVVGARVGQSIEAAVRRCQQDNARRVAQAAAEMAQLQDEQAGLEAQARALVDVAAEMTSDGRLRSISADDFPERVAEIQNAIEEVVEARREQAVTRLREDIARQFPGIEFRGANVAAAVKSHIRERIRAKEHECQEILRKGELREKRLREKLDDALARVQKLQGKSGQDFQFLDEFERSKREWEDQRRKLDAKMSALVSGQGSGE